MRGSPFLRTVCYALALAAAAFGLSRVTAHRPASPSPTPVAAATTTTTEATYELTLSAPAREVRLNGRVISGTALAGKLTMDPADPRLTLAVAWEQPPAAGVRRFAKLVIDPPGKPSILHVFDAAGDIDDVFEPLPDALK